MINTYHASETKPADEGTKPFRIVLHDKFGTLSTHMHTTDDNGYHNGNYFPDASPDAPEVLADYKARCARYGLNPNL